MMGACLLLANKLYLRTNFFRNRYVYISQFRILDKSNIIYDVVNVGSNPARFSFFYEAVNGSNWSTGTQGLDMDLDILKAFSSHLHKGSYVLLPIVPFSSISGCLESKSLSYLSKFALAFQGTKKGDESQYIAAKKWINTAFFRDIYGNIKILFRDCDKDCRLEISDMLMMKPELEDDAKKWMKCWKNEFNIHSFEDPLCGDLLLGRQKTVRMFREMLEYCFSKGYKPIIISPPLQKELGKLFTPEMKELYVDSFVREFENYNIPYFDYIYDDRFSSSGMFFNSLFMNLRGRKLFTKEILNRLRLNG